MKRKFVPYNIFRSFSFAIQGFLFAVLQEWSLKIQLAAGLFFTIFTSVFQLWTLLAAHLILMSVVIGFELINTAVEELCDLVQPQKDDRVKKIKDVMAAAVLLVSLAWFCILVVIVYSVINKL